MEDNIILPADVNVAGQPITFTVAADAASQNCYVDLRYPQPYYGNTTYSSATYLYMTEDQLRQIVREEVSKAIEGLGKRVLRRTGARKTE